MLDVNNMLQLYAKHGEFAADFDVIGARELALLGIQNGWLRLVFAVYREQVLKVTDCISFQIIDESGALPR